MGFAQNSYGLWGFRELWVMGQYSPHTIIVIPKSYGVLESMGFQGYGIRESRLYFEFIGSFF
jgi:hypothetical protein